jgi:rhodanese-related sulfurtransferase
MRHPFRRVGTGLWVVILAMAVTVITLVGLTGANAQHPPGKDLLMAFAEFQPLQAQKSVLVIDVRDAESFANGRIPGALHVPVRDIEVRLASVKKASKGRVIVTYCSCPTESSSLRAASLLSGAGVRAKALVGGFPRWVESGGVIERG